MQGIFYSALGCISLLMAFMNVLYTILDFFIMFVKNDCDFYYRTEEGKWTKTNLVVDIFENLLRAFICADIGLCLIGVGGTISGARINSIKSLF